MKKILPVLIIYQLLFTTCQERQKSELSDSELKALWKREKENAERAKYGGGSPQVTVLTDRKKVNQLKVEVKKNIEKKRQEDKEKLKNENIGDRYRAGDKTVVPEIIKVLKGRNHQAKTAIYYGLQPHYDTPSDYQISEPALIELILKNIDHPEDEEESIQLAGRMALPGYVDKFENYLFSGKSKSMGRIIYWLGVEGTSQKVLSYIEALILEKKVDLEKEYWIMAGLEEFAKSNIEEISNNTIELCYKIYNNGLIRKQRFQEIKDSYSSHNPAIGLIDILLEHGDQRSVPMAMDLVEKEMMEERALRALIRLEGTKHENVVLKYLKSKEKFFDGLNAAAMLYKSTRNEKIIREILLQCQKREDYDDYLIRRVVEAIIDSEATTYFDQLDKVITDQKLIKALQEIYELTKGNIEGIARDLYEMGVVDKPFGPAIIHKAKENMGEDVYTGYIHAFLTISGIFLWFDAEAGFVPVDYDQLINSLCRNSGGKFEDVLIWMDARGDPNLGSMNYEITLIAGEWAYIMKPQDLEDWYDVESILNLLNRALADSGLKERYVFIDTGDQTVQVMFGPANNVKKFVKKYKLQG